MIAEPFLSSTCSVIALCPVELFTRSDCFAETLVFWQAN